MVVAEARRWRWFGAEEGEQTRGRERRGGSNTGRITHMSHGQNKIDMMGRIRCIEDLMEINK
jgi:hypothetical protein